MEPAGRCLLIYAVLFFNPSLHVCLLLSGREVGGGEAGAVPEEPGAGGEGEALICPVY